MPQGFVTWFYRDGTKRVIQVWLRFVVITYETFSIEFLLQTLFAAWKRDIIVPINPTFQDLIQAFGFNLIARLVGLAVRSLTIVAGLLVTGLVFAIAGTASLFIFVFPWFLFPTYKYLKEQSSPLIIEPLESLVTRPEVVFVLRHGNLEPGLVAARVQQPFDQPSLQQSAQHFAQALRSTQVQPTHLLLGYFEASAHLQKLLTEHDLTIDELAEIVAWQTRLWQRFVKPPLFVNPAKIKTSFHIGYDWASGYTPTLNRFATQIIESAKPQEYLAHQNVVDQVVTILRRSGKHNVILVGDPGVGKATIVGAIAVEFGDSKKVFALEVNRLISALSLADDFETRLVAVLNDTVHAGDVVLYVEELENLLTTQPNAIAILQPYLESPALQLLATTTFPQYHKIVEADPILTKNFERVDVNEPTDREIMLILEDIAPFEETRSKVILSYQAIREIVRVADRYLSNKRFPEKAIDLLDEVVANCLAHSVITAQAVDKLISAKTHTPVGEPLKQEKQLLLKLEQILHQNLVNQDQAVSEIAQALRRVRAGVIEENKPIGSFLFLGPTGVGKTQTAKTLAQAYFGQAAAMVRFDMSEYQSAQSAERLMSTLAARLSQTPFTLLLLDEIEKAHPDILNLFLQVLDEAKLTSPDGRPIDFRNAIIIATSNAGSEYIRQKTRSGEVVSSNQLFDFVQRQGILKPEFLNRFTAMVAFQPLNQDQLVEVVSLILERINATLANQQIKIVLDQTAKQKLAQLGFDPVFGARALERAMRQRVEDLVANKILKDELKKGGTFTITAEMI